MKLHSEKFFDLLSSTIFIRVIDSVKMKETGLVSRVGDGRIKFLVEKPELKIHLQDLGVDDRKMLMWMLMKSVGRAWTVFIWFRVRKTDGLRFEGGLCSMELANSVLILILFSLLQDFSNTTFTKKSEKLSYTLSEPCAPFNIIRLTERMHTTTICPINHELPPYGIDTINKLINVI
jgi:hypothetical protein